jgi:membrane protease YdiL (CAAX protease family)
MPLWIRLTLLMCVSFSGVLVISGIDSIGGRHLALAAWFVVCALATKRVATAVRKRKPPGGVQFEGLCDRPTVKLNEKYFFVTWWGKPQSPVGATLVALYAAASLLMFTLSDANNQWWVSFVKLPDTWDAWAEILLYCGAVPLYEEFYFRAALLPAFLSMRKHSSQDCPVDSSFPVLSAVYINALVFWLFHLPPDAGALFTALAQGTLPLAVGPFLLGLACAFVAVRDRSVWMAVALHALANASGAAWQPMLEGTGLFSMFYR